MTFARRARGAAAAFLAVLVAAVFGVATPAGQATAAVGAAGTDGPAVTWSVRPADDVGADGRRVVDVVLEPGGQSTEHVEVTNHSAVAVTFAITANDGYLTERGSFDMQPSGTTPVDGGSWLSLPDEATVGAGESIVVPVEITVPDDATPGDHPAGVAASILSAGSEVAVESRVGVRVNLTVAGDAVAALDANITGVSYEPSWNPFAPGGVVVHYDAVNTGTVGLSAAGSADVSTLLGDVPGAADGAGGGEPREVLPGGRIEQSIRVSGVWPLGPTRVELDVEPLLDEGASVPAPPATVAVSATVWALPLAQFVLVVLLVLLVLVVRLRLRRRRARLRHLLAEARAEGAAEARAARGSHAGEPGRLRTTDVR